MQDFFHPQYFTRDRNFKTRSARPVVFVEIEPGQQFLVIEMAFPAEIVKDRSRIGLPFSWMVHDGTILVEFGGVLIYLDDVRW